MNKPVVLLYYELKGQTTLAMLKNYFIVAFRNLLKNKSYMIINTFGLGIALACCITAYILVAYNIEFDNFHDRKAVVDIYKIHTHILEKDGNILQNINSPFVLPPIMARDISGVDRYTRFIYEGAYVRFGDNAFSEGIAFSDSTFFEMFDFPVWKGDLGSFKNKETIILSKRLADKYFIDENPIGQTMILNFTNQKEIQVVVGAVLEKVPLNNTFVFDAMMRTEHFQDIHGLKSDSWEEWRDPSVFLQVSSRESVTTISEMLDKYIPIRNEAKEDQNVVDYQLEQFHANYNQDDINWSQVNVRMNLVPLLVFTLMALMILLIACFNLTNTSIAMTAKRMKEVGVRKALGATKSQVVIQFFFEMVITIVIALLAGLVMSRIIVPAFVEMWDLQYGLDDMSGLNLFIALIILVFVASLLAGVYPALFNSKFSPVALLKGKVKIKGTNALTKSLVALQFAISVIVLVAGVIFIQNTRYQEDIKFGYDKEMVVTIRIQNESEYEVIRNKVVNHPKIQAVGITDHQVGWSTYNFPVHIDTAEYNARLVGVGEHYFEVMGFQLAEGRFLNFDNALDREQGIVVNKSFLQKTGVDNPFETWITVHDKRRRIVGIIEDHLDNLFYLSEGEPFLFYPALSNEYKMMLVRADEDQLSDVDQYLEDTWKESFPTKPYESRYQEDMVLGEVLRTNRILRRYSSS